MENEEAPQRLFLEIKNVHPHEYIEELRVALLYLIRLHFEGPAQPTTTEEEQFALYRLTDFLIQITKGDLLPIEFGGKPE
jgi:hypothetical protein